ncbi:MAG: chemotaxis protein methyltransferase [Myxococcales bacterium]|nr:chemotaxis protein methyltransferase [Myxococcales bacterium]
MDIDTRRGRIKSGARTKATPVLVVDDNRDIADVLARLLRMHGHRVRVAYDGPSALAAVTRFRPRVALVDLGLPAMDGYELARRLRQKSGLEQLTLLALSGHVQPADRARAQQAGFSEHFGKPFDLERLLETVDRV